jgi:hypothetical protein
MVAEIIRANKIALARFALTITGSKFRLEEKDKSERKT